MGDAQWRGTDDEPLDRLDSLISYEDSPPSKRRRATITSAGHADPPPAPRATPVLQPTVPVASGPRAAAAIAMQHAHGARAAAGPLAEQNNLAGSQQPRPVLRTSVGMGLQQPQQLGMHGSRLLPQTIPPIILPLRASLPHMLPFQPSTCRSQTAVVNVGPGLIPLQGHATSNLAVSIPHAASAQSSMDASSGAHSMPSSPQEPEPNQMPPASPLMPVALKLAVAWPVSSMGVAMAPSAAYPVPADRSQHGPSGAGLMVTSIPRPAAAGPNSAVVSDAKAC